MGGLVSMFTGPPKPPKVDNSEAEARLARQEEEARQRNARLDKEREEANARLDRQEREAEQKSAASIAARRASRAQTIFGTATGVTDGGASASRATLG